MVLFTNETGLTAILSLDSNVQYVVQLLSDPTGLSDMLDRVFLL